MSFVQLVQREMQGSLPRLLFMSALGGISTAAVLASINAGVQSVNGGKRTLEGLLTEREDFDTTE